MIQIFSVNMNRVELLTIADRYQIGRAGLLILPKFSVPNGGWTPRTVLAKIVTPDGLSFETEAIFNLSHLNISDPMVSIEDRWKVTIMLPQKSSEEVPVGSKFFVPREIRDQLLPGSAN